MTLPWGSTPVTRPRMTWTVNCGVIWTVTVTNRVLSFMQTRSRLCLTLCSTTFVVVLVDATGKLVLVLVAGTVILEPLATVAVIVFGTTIDI